MNSLKDLKDFIQEKLIINSKSKIYNELPTVKDDDTLKDALNYLIDTLKDDQYNKYYHTIKNSFGVKQLWNSNLDELFDSLKDSKRGKGKQYLGLNDLMSILKYEQPDIINTSVWEKYNKDSDYYEELTDYCHNIIKNKI